MIGKLSLNLLMTFILIPLGYQDLDYYQIYELQIGICARNNRINTDAFELHEWGKINQVLLRWQRHCKIFQYEFQVSCENLYFFQKFMQQIVSSLFCSYRHTFKWKFGFNFLQNTPYLSRDHFASRMSELISSNVFFLKDLGRRTQNSKKTTFWMSSKGEIIKLSRTLYFIKLF